MRDTTRSARLPVTPGQTIGPFFAFGLEYPEMNRIAFPHSPGAIVLHGSILDGAGAPIPDACIEIWGADSDGTVSRERGSHRRDDRGFTGFGRAFTDDEGRYSFWTRDPGPVGAGAPFFAAVIFARGLPDKLHTRIYPPEGGERINRDPLLSGLGRQERATLIARRLNDGSLRHDIRLQGEKETVFRAF